MAGQVRALLVDQNDIPAYPNTSTTPNYVQQVQNTYVLASNLASLAPGATIGLTLGILGGSYIFAYQFTGTTPTLILEALGPDGTSYQTVVTVSTSGAQGIVLGNNATVRLRNSGANAITSLSGDLS